MSYSELRRIVTSLPVHDRLQCASEFLANFPGEEILLVSSTRMAADEFVRQACITSKGVFGVHRFTLPQFAFTLAEERLAQTGKSILSGVAMDALAARAVHECRSSGQLTWFDPVATTPGFFRALASTISELRLNNMDPGKVRGVLPSGPDLANLLDQFDRSLKDTDVADLATAYRTVTAVIGETEFRFRGRPLLLLDIVPTSYLEQETIRALSHAASAVLATAHQRDQSSIQVLEQALGVEAQPLPVKTTANALDRLRTNVFERTAPAGEIDSTVEFLSATDESRECAEIARSILALAQSGIPFDRMAIALRNPEAYQPLVEDSLRRANVPGFFTLGSRRPNPAGRSLLALLACASEGLSASRFSEYLSLGQVPNVDESGKPAPRPPQWVPVQGELFPEIPVPEIAEPVEENADDDDDSPVISGSLRAPYQWEKLLVDAAVIGGHDRWIRRLEGLKNELKKQISEVETEEESKRQALERRFARLNDLQRFALPLIRFLDELPDNAIWNDWLDALEKLTAMAIRRPEFVLAVLAELRPMSTLGPVTLDEVREVLTHRLTFLRTDSPERRYGKVLVATTAELAGLSFDVVFLPGLAEDIFPKKAFEDPLLLDDARRQIDPWLATQNSRTGRERLLLHIAAGAARSRLWISYPRMNLGQGRSRSPSFYALDILRAMTGKVPNLRELQQRSTGQTQAHIGWPAPNDPGTAIDDAEYDLAVISGLLRIPAEQAKGRARYLLTASPILGRSLRTRAGRWRRRWTEGDGIVATDASVIDVLAPHRLTARPYSATALQQFAACPYRFLLYAIHRIQPRDEAVAIERIDALTRGSLIHTAQYRLLSELRGLNLLPIQAENLSQVVSVADRVFDEVVNTYREECAPAIPRIWESQIEDIRWDLRGWLKEMCQPVDRAWTPRWFELSFGLPMARDKDPGSSDEPVLLPDGTRVRGAIDMVEERDGTIRITDHKTGKALAQPPGLTGHGEILQPILYAQAAEAILGKPAESARLFFCTDRGGYRSVEIPINEQSRQSLSNVTALIDRSIAEGFLPAAPAGGACSYCDYRLVCGPYEEARIRSKSPDRLALLTELRELP
ncbi:MAG TPA: PD-(D/E)XK nuclease family protein [Terriglobia bacterium]